MVPHVYIYGGWITGKDLSGGGIGCALILQLAGILLFAFLSLRAAFSRQLSGILYPLLCQLVLLTLFPFWIRIYIRGVINNSEGAHLSVHWQFGMAIYGVIAVLTVAAWIWILLAKESSAR